MTLLAQLTQKESELNDLQSQAMDLDEKLKDIECNPQEYTDLESMYDDFLDEYYSEVCEALPVSISGSQVLKEFDAVAYCCGFSDYCADYDYASLDIYTETESELEDINEQIEQLETEIEEIQELIEANEESEE